MKKLLLLFFAIALLLPASGQIISGGIYNTVFIPASSAVVSWPPAGDILSADFESTSSPNSGWNNDGGTPSWGYNTSPAPLAGSFSLKLVLGDFVDHPITVGSTFYAAFVFNCPSTVADGPQIIIFSASGATECTFYVTGSGAILAYNGTVSATSGGGVVSAGTTYFAWVKYVESTGANGITQVWISTSSTKPGSPTVSVTTGDSAVLPGSCVFHPGVNDSIIVDTLRISANPQ